MAIFSDSVGAWCSAAKCQRSGRFLSVRPTRSNARRVAHSRRSKARPSLAAVGHYVKLHIAAISSRPDAREQGLQYEVKRPLGRLGRGGANCSSDFVVWPRFRPRVALQGRRLRCGRCPTNIRQQRNRPRPLFYGLGRRAHRSPFPAAASGGPAPVRQDAYTLGGESLPPLPARPSPEGAFGRTPLGSINLSYRITLDLLIEDERITLVNVGDHDAVY